MIGNRGPIDEDLVDSRADSFVMFIFNNPRPFDRITYDMLDDKQIHVHQHQK